MTTASALAHVTDRGKFERVAIQVLRQFNDECAAVLRSGTNALDEPIPAPVDGFCRVPGRFPPRFVLIECTTTDPARLRAKWLSGWSAGDGVVTGVPRPDEAGDLVKAALEARALRARFPDASFKIYLVVNHLLAKLRLYADVQYAADELGVECEICDGSVLADWLDLPEGQVFRRELGIPARDLSRRLLKEIGHASLEQARREAWTDPGLWIDRATGVRLRSLLSAGGHRLIALVAGPGRGKTTLGLQALDAHLRSGGLGLCVDAERIADCNHMDEAIGRTLRSFAPDLAPGQAESFRQLFGPGMPLLVLLEDVNRSDRAAWLLQRLIKWTSPPRSSDTGPGGHAPVDNGSATVLVPVWPVYREDFGARLRESPWVATLEVDRLEHGEADEALRRVLEAAGCAMGRTRRSEIVHRLERDPVLIGLLGRLLNMYPGRDVSELSTDVFGHYHDRCIEEATAQAGGSLLKADLLLALNCLADRILRQREINPSWPTVRGWFSGDPGLLSAVTALAGHGGIVRMEHIGADSRLVFRHDRLMQETLSRSLATSIERGDRPDALYDPYFAETTGQALRRVTVDRGLLSEVADRCPLALIEAVRVTSSGANADTRALLEEASAWCARVRASGQTLPAVLDGIAGSLLTTDSPNVLEFVRLLPRHPLLLLAGLRNGSADCGVSYLALGRHFWAGRGDYQLERAVEVALARHRDRIIGDLGAILRDTGLADQRRKGAIELAGYIGSSDLELAVAECYEHAQDRGLAFVPTLWAALRCLGDDPDRLAIPMLEAWSELSDAPRYEGGGGDRSLVAESLSMAFAKGLPDRTVRFLAREYRPEFEEFERRLFWVFEYVNHPDAIEYRIQYAARLRAKLKPGHISFALQDVTRPWDTVWDSGRWKLSDASRDRARELWCDPIGGVDVRDTAFRVWLTRCGAEDVPTLRGIEPSSPLFPRALRERARLGDASCIPALIEEIRQFSWYFCLAPPVWCAELHHLADEHLASFQGQIPTDFTGGESNDHFALSELLMRIPRDEAEGLMAKHWEHVRYSPLFIHAALFVGTPRCLALADAAIRECPPQINVLERVARHFGIMVSGRQDSVTLEHLDRLLPYVDRLDAMSVRMIAEFCNRRGHQEWAWRHLLPYLAEADRAQVCPTEADIERELDRSAGDEGRSIWPRYWAEEGAGRLVPPAQLIGILRRWIGGKGDLKAWQVAAEIIAAIGSRSDLNLLEHWPPTHSDEGRLIIVNTRYRVERRSLQ